jgi:ABC-2 type transport system ATP-binding protein
MAETGAAAPVSIQALGLCKSFRGRQAVKTVDLAVRKGEIYGLVGPDGAGKTTTFRLLCAALRPDSGRAEIGGFDMSRQPEQGRALIGYLPQRFSLYEELTVSENLRFFAEVRGLQPQEWQARSRQILDFVDLAAFTDRQARQLSGGMKQKLGLAAALVHRPQVLLLDEPTTGVDPVTRQDFWQLIIRLVNEQSVAVMVSTPYMDEATRCHRLGFMRSGELLLEGTPAALRRRLDNQVLELQGEPLARMRQIAAADEAVQAVQLFGDRLHVRIQAGTGQQVIARLQHELPAQGLRLDRIRLVPAQLEDVFLSLVEAGDG